MVQKNTIGMFSNQNWKLDTVSTNDFYKESNGQTFFNLNEKIAKRNHCFSIRSYMILNAQLEETI